MKTKKGNRTAHFGVQIVEEGGPGGDITLFFDGHDLPPIIFNRKSGASGAKAHEKLKSILDEEEPVGG
jgi:hypothetical protein